MKAIKFNTVIGSISCKMDGSVGLRLSTPELRPEEKVELMKLQGIALDATLEPLDGDIVETITVDRELEEKTPSQRLRAVFYLWWKQSRDSGFTSEDFPTFYRREYDKLIEHYKNKLEN